MIKAFIHQPLNYEITSIGGYYVMTKEVCITLGDRKIFYMTGYAAFDTSCCGTGGCAFANTPGFVISWKDKINSDGFSVSAIEPIADVNIQNMIRNIIRKNEGINQVNFDL